MCICISRFTFVAYTPICILLEYLHFLKHVVSNLFTLDAYFYIRIHYVTVFQTPFYYAFKYIMFIAISYACLFLFTIVFKFFILFLIMMSISLSL